jgi:hypothetical protein
MDDWQKMLSQFQQPLSDAQEIERLELLLQSANKQLQLNSSVAKVGMFSSA